MPQRSTPPLSFVFLLSLVSDRVVDEETVWLTIWRLLDGGFAVGRFSDGRLAGERDPLVVYTKMDGGFNVNGLQKNCGLRKEAEEDRAVKLDEHLVTYFPSLGDLGRRVHLLPHLQMNLNLSAEAIAIRVLQFSADTYEGKTVLGCWRSRMKMINCYSFFFLFSFNNGNYFALFSFFDMFITFIEQLPSQIIILYYIYVTSIIFIFLKSDVRLYGISVFH